MVCIAFSLGDRLEVLLSVDIDLEVVKHMLSQFNGNIVTNCMLFGVHLLQNHKSYKTYFMKQFIDKHNELTTRVVVRFIYMRITNIYRV